MTRNNEITIETGTDTTHEISLFYSHGGWSIVWWVADYPDVPREGLDALHDYFRDEFGIPEDVTAKNHEARRTTVAHSTCGVTTPSSTTTGRR